MVMTSSAQNKSFKTFHAEPRPPGIRGQMQRLAGLALIATLGGSVYIVLGLIAAIIRSICNGQVIPATILLGLFVIDRMVPLPEYQQDPSIGRHWLMRELVSYFSMSFTMEEALDTTKNYMFAQFPHGILPCAVFLSAYFVEEVLAGRKIFGLVHSNLFHLPFIRHIVAAVGAAPVTAQHIKEVREKLNESCSVVVGGVSEMWLIDDKVEQLRLRKGFIREALKNDYELVPIFYYGHSRVYTFLGSANIYKRISKHLPFPFFLYKGWYGTVVPNPVPIFSVVGKPVDIKGILGGERKPHTDPTAAEVQKVYDQFKADLIKLYYTHRPEWEKRDLRILED